MKRSRGKEGSNFHIIIRLLGRISRIEGDGNLGGKLRLKNGGGEEH